MHFIKGKLAWVLLCLLDVSSGPLTGVQASDGLDDDGANNNDILSWPGDWVAGHLEEPGLALPSNTQGVFSSSYSGPKGQKGAIGQFNNNGVTGLVDENGHIRTINGPLPAMFPGKRTTWWSCWPFWRDCNGVAATSNNGGSFAAEGSSTGRKLAKFGGRGFEGGRGFDSGGSAAAAAAASGGGFIGRKLTDFGGFDGGRGFQRGFDGRGFEGGRDFFNRGFDGGRDFFNRGFDDRRGFSGNWWGRKLMDFGGRGFEHGFEGGRGFDGGGTAAAAAAAAAAASGGGFFGRKLADFGGRGFERGFEGERGFDGGFDGGDSAAAASAAAAASGEGFIGRKLADSSDGSHG